jgi:hypothetical protein
MHRFLFFSGSPFVRTGDARERIRNELLPDPILTPRG